MLKLQTLSYCHLRGDLIDVYKMLHGSCDKEAASFIKIWMEMAHRWEVRWHSLKVYLQRSSKPIRKKSFDIRKVTAWNNLIDEVANAPSINTFKNILYKHWKDQDILYGYKSTLNTPVTRKGSKISIGTNPESQHRGFILSGIQVWKYHRSIKYQNPVQDSGATQTVLEIIAWTKEEH